MNSNLDLFVVIKENIQLVEMWLSTDTTAVLDNALITMEYLFRSGKVSFFQNRLLSKTSYYEVKYSIDRISNTPQSSATSRQPNADEESDKIMFTLDISDVDDHKRQLTFCNVDVDEKSSQKVLVSGQLAILDIAGKIFSMYCELEALGHPDYQLRKETLDIQLNLGENNDIISLSIL